LWEALRRGGVWGCYAVVVCALLGSIETYLIGSHVILCAAPLAGLSAVVLSVVKEVVDKALSSVPTYLLIPLLAIILYPFLAAVLAISSNFGRNSPLYLGGAVALGIAIYSLTQYDEGEVLETEEVDEDWEW